MEAAAKARRGQKEGETVSKMRDKVREAVRALAGVGQNKIPPENKDDKINDLIILDHH